MPRRFGAWTRRSAHALLFIVLLDLLFIYFVALSRQCPPPSEMEISTRIVEGLKDATGRDAGWLSLSKMFENISSTSSFQKPQVWWIYKVLSHGNRSCEGMLLSLNRSVGMRAREETESLITDLSQAFKRIDVATSEFVTYYVFLATLALFFSTIMFLGGKASQIRAPPIEVSGGLLTYFYPLLLSFGLACSLYTEDLYPLFSWVPYTAFMLIVFKTIGYDRSGLFGFSILTGGLLGAYSPIYPFYCLFYFGLLSFFMLILLPAVLPGISRDILLAMSILAGCGGVNGAISMTFIHANISPSIALVSVAFDLISIMFALSEVSALPRVLEAGIRSVAREGFWPICGFTTSVLFLAFGLLAYFNPVPSLPWILFLSLLSYALIYSMRAYALRRKRLAKFGEMGDVRALFLISIPGLVLLGIFPTLCRARDPTYLLFTNFSLAASAVVFATWYIRGDRSLRGFLLEPSPVRFIAFALALIIAGPVSFLLNPAPGLQYLSLIAVTLGLLLAPRRRLERHLGYA